MANLSTHQLAAIMPVRRSKDEGVFTNKPLYVSESTHQLAAIMPARRSFYIGGFTEPVHIDV